MASKLICRHRKWRILMFEYNLTLVISIAILIGGVSYLIKNFNQLIQNVLKLFVLMRLLSSVIQNSKIYKAFRRIARAITKEFAEYKEHQQKSIGPLGTKILIVFESSIYYSIAWLLRLYLAILFLLAVLTTDKLGVMQALLLGLIIGTFYFISGYYRYLGGRTESAESKA